MRAAYLRHSTGTRFYRGTFGAPGDPYSISILPKPQKQWLSGGKGSLFEAVITPVHRVVEYDEYLIVKAPTLPELIDKLNISHAITVEFIDPEPAVAELLKRPKQTGVPERFDAALDASAERASGWRRRAHENAKKRSLKNNAMARKVSQLDMFEALA